MLLTIFSAFLSMLPYSDIMLSHFGETSHTNVTSSLPNHLVSKLDEYLDQLLSTNYW